jgi:hypothetical protein
MKLSEFINNSIKKALRGVIEDNVIYIGTDVSTIVELDQLECYQMLNRMGIVPKFVLRYLKMKYKPVWKADNLAIFEDVNCIKRAVYKDKLLMIDFYNSEPHKLPTDIKYVLNLFKSKGVILESDCIKIRIENLKILPQDILLYRAFMPEVQPSIEIREYADALIEKYPNLYKIATIKKRSIKRKYLRYYVVRNIISWEQLRVVMNITDFSEENIKKVIDALEVQVY